MVFRSYDSNSVEVFRTPYHNPGEDSSELGESGSVYSDPTSKSVRFAKWVVSWISLLGAIVVALLCYQWRIGGSSIVLPGIWQGCRRTGTGTVPISAAVDRYSSSLRSAPNTSISLA